MLRADIEPIQVKTCLGLAMKHSNKRRAFIHSMILTATFCFSGAAWADGRSATYSHATCQHKMGTLTIRVVYECQEQSTWGSYLWCPTNGNGCGGAVRPWCTLKNKVFGTNLDLTHHIFQGSCKLYD